jgi:protein SCO1/2
MNRGAMSTLRVRFLALCLPLALFAAGCDAPAGEPPLAGAAIGGPFELTDSKGQTVRWTDFDGSYRIVYFGFTYCPDVCPTDIARMSQGLTRFERAAPERAAKVQPIFISVDPGRDTPEKLGEFAANFHPRLVALTGSPEQIAQATKAFGAFYELGKDQGQGSYMVNHSTAMTLFGPEGEPLAILPTNEGPEAVAAELEKWVS